MASKGTIVAMKQSPYATHFVVQSLQFSVTQVTLTNSGPKLYTEATQSNLNAHCTVGVWLLQVGPSAFKLHLKPHTPDAPRQQAHTISPAGQGLGLQVFPGSMPDVDCVSPTLLTLTQ